MTPVAVTPLAWVFIVLPVLLVWVLGIVDILRRRDLPGSKKAAWILLVVLLPIVGTLIYFLLLKPTPDEIRGGSAASADRRSDPLRDIDPRPPLE